MAPLVYISTLIIFYLCPSYGQSPCSTPRGSDGSCVPVHRCHGLYDIVKNVSNATTEQRALVQKSICDFDDSFTLMVCCPLNSCITAEGAQGTCTTLRSCPHLLDTLINNYFLLDTFQQMQRYRCGLEGGYGVCCRDGETASTIKPVTENLIDTNTDQRGQCRLTAAPPDASTNCCGHYVNVDPFSSNDGDTALDDFPWLAIIEYEMNKGTRPLCVGALISGQYVLTSAYCLKGPVLRYGKIVSVKLGEYNTTNEGPDCVDTNGGGRDCNGGVKIVGIEKTISHPDYNRCSNTWHDIGLIRLAELVPFTDFIQPICLPTEDFTRTSRIRLYVAGWGSINKSDTNSNVKQKGRVVYVEHQFCQSSYSAPSRNVKLWEGQTCAGALKDREHCKVDYGGPLMLEKDTRMEVVGIVSFGPLPCSMADVPSVYTNVYHYMPWIKSEIVGKKEHQGEDEAYF